jgi:hypothetical protein
MDVQPLELRLVDYPVYKILALFLVPLLFFKVNSSKQGLYSLVSEITNQVELIYKVQAIPNREFFSAQLIAAYERFVNAKGRWCQRLRQQQSVLEHEQQTLLMNYGTVVQPLRDRQANHQDGQRRGIKFHK